LIANCPNWTKAGWVGFEIGLGRVGFVSQMQATRFLFLVAVCGGDGDGEGDDSGETGATGSM
jgi:hypothetical protein